MSSGYSPWYKRKILYHIPGLFKKCPEGNYHWFWDRFCCCCDDCALLDMKTGIRYMTREDYLRILSELYDDGSVEEALREKTERLREVGR